MLLARFFVVISAISLLLCSPGSSWPQSQLRGQPRLPFTDEGACPFEGCHYAAWTAKTATVARRDANTSSPVVFTIKSGEKITALNGKVITLQFGIIKILKPVVFDEVETRTVPYTNHKIDIPAGAVLYLLHEEGEGYCLYWYNGATHHQDLYAETVHKGDADFPWDVISLPKTEWWVNVKNHDGQTGWILNPFDFRGIDALGGDN
jgi:hypothetical protein